MSADKAFDELFDSIHVTPIATVVTDPRLPDNPIVAVNKAFSELTGYSAAEVMGKNCRFLAGAGTASADSAGLRHAVQQARPFFAELINYRRDGSQFRNAVMIAPVFDDEGQLSYFIGSQMDISGAENSQLGERRRQASQLLQRLTHRQRQVLAEMAQGYRNKQIAVRLGISEKTVKMHRASLLAKLSAATSADAVRIAVEGGL